MYQRTNIQRGMAVMSSDGVQLGRVIDVTADSIIVEKGQFFLRDFRVSFEDISAVRGDELILMRDHAALRQSDSEPAASRAIEVEPPAEEALPRVSHPKAPRFPPHEPPLAERRAAGPGWE